MSDKENNTDDNKEGYDYIPDHDYDEMNESQPSPEEHTALPKIVNDASNDTTSTQDDKLKSHSVCLQSTVTNSNKYTTVMNQQEVESTGYISVTQDMFVPPHKRTIK